MRRIYLDGLKPRWNGSYEAMGSFIEESNKYIIENPQLKLLKGFISADQGDVSDRNKKHDEALKYYNNSLSYGDYWSFYLDRGKCYLYLKKNDLAVKDLSKAISLKPLAKESYPLRSRAYYFEENISAALKDVQIIRQLWPYDEKGLEWARKVAEDLTAKGHKLAESENHEQAVKQYSLAVEFDPTFAETYYWWGRSLVKLKRNQEALELFKKAIGSDPNHFESYRNIDWLLAENRKWSEIVQYWDQFIKLNPNHAGAYLERGGAYFHQKDYALSANDAKKACDLGNQEGCKRYQQVKTKL